MQTAQPTPPPIPFDLASSVEPHLQNAQQNLMRLNEHALTFVRERPVTCLVGAVAIGFVVGKIAARY